MYVDCFGQVKRLKGLAAFHICERTLKVVAFAFDGDSRRRRHHHQRHSVA